MGRETNCEVKWAGDVGQCKVLLESSELILRGALRRRVPISGISAILTYLTGFALCGAPVRMESLQNKFDTTKKSRHNLKIGGRLLAALSKCYQIRTKGMLSRTQLTG
jgi:hypothetical protein